MVLNLHGEVPSSAATNTCVLNAEPAFLPHLRALHARFPRLRIVLEHATTRAAVECVKSLGDTVACTITAHHLALTVDDWAGQAWHFCKPVAKYPDDRAALQAVVREGSSLFQPVHPPTLPSRARAGLQWPPALTCSASPPPGAHSLPHLHPHPPRTSLHSRPPISFRVRAGHPRFFLGSDSAPHPYRSKAGATPAEGCAAGVYTSPILLPLVAHLLESFGALPRLEGFASAHGRAFYGRPAAGDGDATARRVTLRRAAADSVVGIEGYGAGETHVVPFWAGKHIGWEIAEEGEAAAPAP